MKKKSRDRRDPCETWALGPLKDLRNQDKDGHPQTIPRATDQQDPKPVTSKGLINTPSVPKGTVADIEHISNIYVYIYIYIYILIC